MRAALLGCGLERQESPLRLAESSQIVLSPKSMKGIPAGRAFGARMGKKLCTVHLGEVSTSPNEEGRISKGRMTLEV